VTIRARSIVASIVLTVLIVVTVVTAVYLVGRTGANLQGGGLDEVGVLSEVTRGYGVAMNDVYRYAVTGDRSTLTNLDDHLAQIVRAESAFAAMENPGSAESPSDLQLGGRLADTTEAFIAEARKVVADRDRLGMPSILALATFTSASGSLEEVITAISSLEARKEGADSVALGRQLTLLQWLAVGAGIVSIIGVAIVSAVMARSVLRPVRELQRASQALAAGDMEYPVGDGGRDEIGDLSRAFVSMRSDLQESMRRLEEEVVSRTEAQERYELVTGDIARVNKVLEGEVLERERAQTELETANGQLNVQLGDVAAATHEMAMLAEMASMLQADIGASEAYAIIASYSGALLPGTSGALYTMADSRNLLDRTACWGDMPPSADFFAPGDCWSLRLGKLHSPDDEHVFSECRHVDGDDRGTYMCLPLTAQGDAIGVLVIYKVEAAVREGEDRSGAIERARRIALTFGEQVALAISNLKLRESLREQSIRDPLTGLYNRRFMEDSLEREFARARRNSTPISFIMMDIDHFKGYNDRTGHGAGDAVLAAVGAFLRGATRADDVACRYGGEEFLVVLPGADEEKAAERAEEIREGIKALVTRLADHTLPGITMSLGVSQLDSEALTAEAALAAADRALYEAKNTGRNTVVRAGATEAPEAAQGSTGYEEPLPAGSHAA
jgi:diguanylate cyclase (GGDEF)-like protein